MAKKHLKNYSTTLTIRKIQTKMTLRFHLTPVRMAKIKTQVTAYAREAVEQGEDSSISGRSANMYNYFGNQYNGL